MLQTDLARLPEDVRALLAEVGPVWGRDIAGHAARVIEAFTQLHRALGAANAAPALQLLRDQPYGAHERQRIDVYQPGVTAAEGAGRPALIYVHGGGFVEGSRDKTDMLYSNVPRYMARHGIVGFNAGYRLAPAFRFPSGAADVRDAVAWVRAHAQEFGIDPDRIFLMGHSAGAAHAALYAYDRSLHATGGPGIRGLILVSGRVRSECSAANPYAHKVRAYYGDDPQALEAGSAVNHVDARSVRTQILIAEFENPLIDQHCLELQRKLVQVGAAPAELLQLAGHNHTSIAAHIGSADDTLGQQLRAFVAAAG